jgi:1-acyl-sn-glycerol-3-phosphate acyltransferase
MQKILAYPLTVIYLVFFGFFLVLFHPIQWLCFNLFGYQAHKVSVDVLNFFLVRCLHLLGTRFTVITPDIIPHSQPTIIVANHQSMNDIPPLIWFLRHLHPKFISKIELGKGIPSISYNLRHGGSVLIDRKNPVQSVNAIKKMAQYISDYNRAVVIFPEGSRSRNGSPKPFKTKGLTTLINAVPNAVVLPVTINNSWQLLRYGKFPMGIGIHIKITVHSPEYVSDYSSAESLIKVVEDQIKASLKK